MGISGEKGETVPVESENCVQVPNKCVTSLQTLSC